MLITRSIYNCVPWETRIQISVMSRHTQDDGYSTDQRINFDCIREWRPWLAPPDYLIGKYLRGEIFWSEYERKYLEYLRINRVEEIFDLISLALVENVVLMCKEPKPDFCHRRLLAEECHRLNPDLYTSIR